MKPDPEELSRHLHQTYPGANYHSAYEAGFCGLWVHHRLRELGIHNIVVNAADIPGTQKDRLQKEDRRDSRKIANALRAGSLTPIYVPTEQTLNDRSLLRTRRSLAQDLGRFKVRIKSLLYFHGVELPEGFQEMSRHWSKRFIDWLKVVPMKTPSGEQALASLIRQAEMQRDLLKDVTRQIRALADSDRYREKVILLRSVPGIALVNAMFLLTEVEDINRFPDSERFCSYIGLIPMSHSSGEKENIGGITFRAHGHLRNHLIEAAWVAIRVDPALLSAYQHYIRRMEPNNAIIRIARKLANRIYRVWKNDEPYQYNKTGTL